MLNKILLRVFICLVFKLEKVMVKRQIQKNLQLMGYTQQEAKMIAHAHRKALLMCRDLFKKN